MSTTETTPGTTADGTTTVAGTTVDGSLSESERQELENLRQGKQQWLGEKSKFEATSAELEEANRRLEAQTSPPPTQQGYDPITANVQAKYFELVLRAQSGDTDAQFQLAQIQGQQAQIHQVRRDSQLGMLSDELRPKVEALLQRNPNLDVPTARQIAEGDLARSKLRDYETKEAEARRLAEEQARASTATGTTSIRPAPASEVQTGTIKASVMQQRYADLNRRIKDGDRAAREEAFKLGNAIDSGTLKVILNE